MKKFFLFLTVFTSIFFYGCSNCSTTADIPAVSGFDVNRYLGKWYEIARLPFYFEKDMSMVTANYFLTPDGKLHVINSGIKNGKPKEIHGYVRNAGAPGTGELEVSFFRPFYGKYRIIYLDKDYQVALVTSDCRDKLWILSRTPELPPETLADLLFMLNKMKFNTAELIFK